MWATRPHGSLIRGSVCRVVSEMTSTERRAITAQFRLNLSTTCKNIELTHREIYESSLLCISAGLPPMVQFTVLFLYAVNVKKIIQI